MILSGISKLKPYRIHFLYFFIIWWTPTILDGIFGKYGGVTGGILQLMAFSISALFLLGSFYKTKNGFVFGLFIFMLFLSVMRIFALLNIHFRTKLINDPIGIFILIISLVAIFSTTHKFSSGFIWFRHLPLFLEMAAQPIIAATNGYTSRPFPVGKLHYSKDKIIQFAKYLHKELIATTYVQDDRVILVFSNGLFQYIPFLKPDFNHLSYVSFNYQGEIAVNFARRDYKKYWDEITFDQLCNSFGNIIIDFFEAFKKREQGNFFQDLNRKGLRIRQPEFSPPAYLDHEGKQIKKINIKWVILSGVFLFFVFITVEGFIETTYLFFAGKQDMEMWQKLTAHWGAAEILLNISVAMAKFIIIMWIYAALIPRFGVGLKNALITCSIAILLLYLQAINTLNLGLVEPWPAKLWISDVIFNLIEMPIALYAGAWLYRED